MAVCLATLAAPAVAQRTTFNPTLSLSAFYTDNVFFVGDPTRDTSSTGMRLGLVLPLRRDLRNGTFELIYTPTFETFTDFSDLDSPGHRLRLELEKEPTGRSRLTLSGLLESSERQGQLELLEESEPFLRQRTRREGGTFDAFYNYDTRGRLVWRASAGYSRWTFPDVNDPASANLEDKTQLRGNLGVGWRVGKRSTLGLAYGYSRFELDLSGDDIVHSVALTYGRTIDDRFTFAASAGCFQRDDDEDEDAQCNLLGGLNFGRTFRRTDLLLNLSHQPAAGGSRLGTSTNTRLGATLRNREAIRWPWGVTARYARRDPTDPMDAEIDTFSLGGTLGRRLSNYIGLSLRASLIEQSSDDPRNDGSFYRASIGVLIHPFGRARGARL